MKKPIRILLQTTIPTTDDDWHIGRVSLLHQFLNTQMDNDGNKLFEVTSRNREANSNGDDELLSNLDKSNFDQLWLFAVDLGDGLSEADCRGITGFRQRGGGMMTTRDHQDLGSSLCTLGGVGNAHFFHSINQEPEEAPHPRDDQDSPEISWPNYHSGRNGDYHRLTPVEPIHELLYSSRNPGGVIEYFPAHPHEGAVGVPDNEANARVVATGISASTQRPFNLMVAFESANDRHGNKLGRAIADASFHHFVDYNWDTSKGCPGFLVETPGDQIKREPEKLEDVKDYVRNVALWLSNAEQNNRV